MYLFILNSLYLVVLVSGYSVCGFKDSIWLGNQLFLETFGSIKVAELQWGDESHIKAVGPPFDYIIGTDVVSVYPFC